MQDRYWRRGRVLTGQQRGKQVVKECHSSEIVSAAGTQGRPPSQLHLLLLLCSLGTRAQVSHSALQGRAGQGGVRALAACRNAAGASGRPCRTLTGTAGARHVCCGRPWEAVAVTAGACGAPAPTHLERADEWWPPPRLLLSGRAHWKQVALSLRQRGSVRRGTCVKSFA